MTDKKRIWPAVLMGLSGGAFIALGALSAIAFTEKAEGSAAAIAMVIAGAVLGIAADMKKMGRAALVVIPAVLFAIGRLTGFAAAEYAAAGAVMYSGCVFALPEEDNLTNAVTGAAAMAGFAAAVILMI